MDMMMSRSGSTAAAQNCSAATRSLPTPCTNAGTQKRRCWHSTGKLATPSAAPWPSAAPRQHQHHHAATYKSRVCVVAAAAASDARGPDPSYMEEYKQLKDRILTTARKSGAALALYLLFVVDGEAGMCALIGMAANNLYLTLLFRDVDAYTGDSRVPMLEAEQVQVAFARNVAKVGAAYQHALQPRLLVPVGVALLAAVWNALLPDSALDLAHQGSLLGGFLMYKVPLVLLVADDNLPKSYGDDEMSRPIIDKFDDDLDRWGRPRKSLVTMPTEALPDNIDTSQALPTFEALGEAAAKLAGGSSSSGSGGGSTGPAPAAHKRQ